MLRKFRENMLETFQRFFSKDELYDHSFEEHLKNKLPPAEIHTFRYMRCLESEANKNPSVAFLFNVDYENRTLKFAVSRCSENDQFSYDIARGILIDRFNSGDVLCKDSYCNSTSLIGHAYYEIMSGLLRDEFTPSEKQFYKSVLETMLYIDGMNNNLYRIWLVYYIYYAIVTRNKECKHTNIPRNLYEMIDTLIMSNPTSKFGKWMVGR